jgi:hypothetical protein
MLGVLAALILVCSSSAAEAKLLEVWGSGLIGGGWGQGSTDKDFYRWVRGGAGGFEVGAKILFIGAFVDYLRWFGGDAGANLITFNLGGDGTIDLTKRLSLVIRIAGGYYLGTLPGDATMKLAGTNVDVTMVNTRGVGVRGGVGLRYTFAKVFSVGCTPEFGYHYFFGGADQSALADNSHGFDMTILGYFRVGIGI